MWDGKPERKQFDYAIPPGSACFLDRMVWHQANPVTAGERWALVIFYKIRVEKKDERAVAATKEDDEAAAPTEGPTGHFAA